MARLAATLYSTTHRKQWRGGQHQRESPWPCHRRNTAPRYARLDTLGAVWTLIAAHAEATLGKLWLGTIMHGATRSRRRGMASSTEASGLALDGDSYC